MRCGAQTVVRKRRRSIPLGFPLSRVSGCCKLETRFFEAGCPLVASAGTPFLLLETLPVGLSCPSIESIRTTESVEPCQSETLVDCRLAVHGLADQLPRSGRHFVRAATHFQRIRTHLAKQGPAAVILLLVVCSPANPHWLVRRPLQFALALCSRVHHLVIRAGPDWPGDELWHVVGLQDSSWHRRIHLPARRNENRQLAIHAERTRFAFGTL